MGNCLKCGNKTTGSAVFCEDCQAVMEAYPVKPGAVAYLLPRPKCAVHKPAESQEAVDKAKIVSQRRMIRWLSAFTIILSLLVMGMTYILIQATTKEETKEPPIGRNYTTTSPKP